MGIVSVKVLWWLYVWVSWDFRGLEWSSRRWGGSNLGVSLCRVLWVVVCFLVFVLKKMGVSVGFEWRREEV